MLDIDSLRNAFAGVRTLFLLNAIAADEYTKALKAGFFENAVGKGP
jgi:hypothetical protein